MNELALFAGAGGGILAGQLLGWRTVCAVEFDAHAAGLLVARQNDGCLEPFPIWDDVRTFDGCEWQGRVDVVSGGFPCQDISLAGGAGQEGIDGERSGLWREMARIVGEVRPRFVFVENSPAIAFRGLGRVIGDLARMGFQCRWGVLGGFSAGGAANGKRMWIVATASDQVRLFRPAIQVEESVAVASSQREFEGAVGATLPEEDHAKVRGNPDDVARWVDRLERAGNGQMARVAALAWRTLSNDWK